MEFQRGRVWFIQIRQRHIVQQMFSNSIKHMDLTPWNAKMKEPGMTAFFHQMRKFRTSQAKEQVINLSNKNGQTKGNYHF